MSYLIRFISILLLCGSCLTEAAVLKNNDFQTWLNITAFGHFHHSDKRSSPFGFWLEDQERIGNNSSFVTQSLLRPGMGYFLNSELSLWLGYAWIRTSHPLVRIPNEENRIWQQLFWIKSTPKNTFINRTRLEQRFFEYNSRVAYRLREMLKASFPLQINSKFSWVISNEFFIRKNHLINNSRFSFDQNRFFTGIGYKFNKVVLAEVGYLNQYIKRDSITNFTANILSLNCYMYFA